MEAPVLFFMKNQSLKKEFSKITRDMTEKKKAEKALKEANSSLEQNVSERTKELQASEERYQDLYQHAPDMFLSIDIKTKKIVQANQTLLTHLGYHEKEFVGRSIFDFYHRGDHDKARKAFSTLLFSGRVQNIELRVKKKNGKYIPVVLNSSALRDAKGKIIVTRSIWRDISDRKSAEEALKVSEAKFREMADTAPVMIWIAGPDKLCNYFNKPWLEFRGRKMAEEAGNGWTEGIHGDDLERCLQIYQSAFDRRKNFKMEYRLKCFDGSYHWVLAQGRVLKTSSGKFMGYIGSCVDITDRIEMEISIKEKEERYRQIVNSSLDAIVGMDEEGRIVEWNPQAETTFGWKRKEVTGRLLSHMIMPLRHRVAHSRGLKHFLATGEGPILNRRIEITAINKKNEEFPVELTVTPLKLKQGTIFSSFVRDISDRKQAEESLMKHAEELFRSNEDLKHFAYVASHDLQEPLHTIISFSDLLKMKSETRLAPEEMDYIDRLRSSAMRMRELIHGLLEYTRLVRQTRSEEKIDLNAVVREVIQDMEPKIKEKNAVVQIEKLPLIKADRLHMRQLFQNLIGNAIKFQKKGSTPQVRVFSSERSDGLIDITVQDNGIGFENKYLDRIFRPFQRLHDRTEYEGIGIGLAACQKIISYHGGRITAMGQPGKGSRFMVSLPKGEMQ